MGLEPRWGSAGCFCRVWCWLGPLRPWAGERAGLRGPRGLCSQAVCLGGAWLEGWAPCALLTRARTYDNLSTVTLDGHTTCVTTRFPPCTVMLHVTMGIRSKKCIAGWFHCLNIKECTYPNLDGISYYTPRRSGYCFWATNTCAACCLQTRRLNQAPEQGMHWRDKGNLKGRRLLWVQHG